MTCSKMEAHSKTITILYSVCIAKDRIQKKIDLLSWNEILLDCKWREGLYSFFVQTICKPYNFMFSKFESCITLHFEVQMFEKFHQEGS